MNFVTDHQFCELISWNANEFKKIVLPDIMKEKSALQYDKNIFPYWKR